MGASTRENTDIRPTNCRFRLEEEGKSYPKSSCQACGATIINLGKSCPLTNTVSKPVSLEGLNAKATIHFSALEISIILADFLNSRGLKDVTANQVTFRVHPASNDPREAASAGLSGADVEVKL